MKDIEYAYAVANVRAKEPELLNKSFMDQLADAGVVGQEEGTKPRKILMTMEEFETLLEE